MLCLALVGVEQFADITCTYFIPLITTKKVNMVVALRQLADTQLDLTRLPHSAS